MVSKKDSLYIIGFESFCKKGAGAQHDNHDAINRRRAIKQFIMHSQFVSMGACFEMVSDHESLYSIRFESI